MIYIDLFLDVLKPLDYLLIILSLFLIFFTTLKGFIQSTLGLMTWIGSIFITIHFHKYLSELISNQVTKWDTISKLLPVHEISKYVLAIPIMFFISLFILKKFRKIISSDLDKNFLGILLDKIFGLVFGVAFTYIIFTTILLSPSIFEFNWLKESFIPSLIENSNLIKEIDKINQVITPNTDIINDKLN